MAKRHQKNAYAVLGLQKGANADDIKTAYVQQVKKYDPEKHTDQFMTVQKAFERLKDPAQRAAEDVNTFNYIKCEYLFNRDEQTEAAEQQITEILEKLTAQKTAGELPAEQADPKLIQGLMLRSWKRVQKKLWSDAIEDWRSVLDLDPGNSRAKNNLYAALIALGYSYAIHELFDEALEVWKQAVQMNPDEPALLHNLALVSERAGNIKDAQLYWTETVRRWKVRLEREPDNEYLKTCIIEALRSHGEAALEELQEEGEEPVEGSEPRREAPRRRGNSIEELRQILAINPEDFEAQFQLANLLLKEQNWNAAIEHLEMMRQKWPRNVEVLNLQGWALLNGGKVDEAFMAWRRGRAIEPKNYQLTESLIKAHMTMGRTLRDKGLFTPCLVHFKALMRYLPENDEVHYEIGKTYQLKNDQRSAFVEYQKVLKINPKHKGAHNAISSLRLQR